VLEWSQVDDRLRTAKNYWLVTVRPDGRPHTVPVWGLWVRGALFFGGHGQKARNILGNPNVAVHLESGDETVVLEGRANGPVVPPTDLVDDLAIQSRAKYGFWPDGEPEPAYALRPTVVRASISNGGQLVCARWRVGQPYGSTAHA
jgi:hypothetical protein